MNFNIKEINEEFNKTKLDIPKINNTKDSEQIKEQKINDEKEKEKELFNSKYILDIIKEELQKKMEEYEEINKWKNGRIFQYSN